MLKIYGKKDELIANILEEYAVLASSPKNKKKESHWEYLESEKNVVEKLFKKTKKKARKNKLIQLNKYESLKVQLMDELLITQSQLLKTDISKI